MAELTIPGMIPAIVLIVGSLIVLLASAFRHLLF
jgi:hypothetical protein